MKTSKLLCLLLLTAFCQSALADTLFVTNSDDSGPGSLRATVAAANAGDVVQFDFPDGTFVSIFLTSGDIPITQSITIEGPAPTDFIVDISSNFSSRIFTVSAPTTISNLTLHQSSGAISGGDVTLTDCLVQDNRNAPAIDATGTWQISQCTFRLNNRGAIHSGNGTVNVEDSIFDANQLIGATSTGGAFRTLGSATFALTNCTLTNNTAPTGGAISSSGTVILTDCIFSNNGNSGTFLGGAINNEGGSLTITRTLFSGNSTTNGLGGAIYSYGDIEIIDSTFSGNTAPSGGLGGAIFSEEGGLIITGAVFSNNSAAGDGIGGAIYSSGPLNILASTFSGNFAGDDGAGGAIYNDGGTFAVRDSTFSGNSLGNASSFVVQGGAIFSDGTMAIANSTIANNTTGTGSQGAGIYCVGTCTLDNSTVSGNAASGPGGGIFSTAAQPASLANTIVAGNTASSGPDISGPITSRGYNLIGDTSGNSGAIGTDLINVDPQLGPLQNNGGPTETMALLPGGPAIDHGDPAFNPNAFTPPMENDQRGVGFPRANGPIDIGAFEAEVAHAPTIDALTGAQTVECTSPQGCGASVSVDVSDSKGHPLTIEWIVNNQVQQTNQIPSGGSTTSGSATYSATFPLGTTAVTVRLNDGEAAPVIASTSVTVVDTTPPTITSISASPNVISSPNKKMVPVTVSVSATDICDPNPTCKIISVTSNEPGPGQSQITGDLTVNLRADRDSHGNGRIYTITVECTDTSNNSSTQTVTVTVPKTGK